MASDRSTKNKENQFHLLSTFSILLFSCSHLPLVFLLYDLSLHLFEAYRLLTRTIPFHILYEDGEGSYYNNTLMVKWWKWQISKCFYAGNVWDISFFFLLGWMVRDDRMWYKQLETLEADFMADKSRRWIAKGKVKNKERQQADTDKKNKSVWNTILAGFWDNKILPLKINPQTFDISSIWSNRYRRGF